MVIVITGPIASGKSTVARQLADELERRGVRTAVIDLDLVHAMLDTTGSTSDDACWTLARRGAAALADTFRQDGVVVVIAEGSYNKASDRAAFSHGLHGDASPFYVTLQVTFEEALRRAQADPTRGISRNAGFLGSYFAAQDHGLAAVPATDLVIDTERMAPTAAAEAIARAARPTGD